LSATAKRITASRLNELRATGVDGADGQLFEGDDEYHWIATSVSFVIFAVTGNEVIIVFAVGARGVK